VEVNVPFSCALLKAENSSKLIKGIIMIIIIIIIIIIIATVIM